MATKQEIQKAKEIDLIELVTRMEIPYKQESGHIKIHCMWHEESHESFAIYNDHYYCFGCQENGDIIDFVRHVYKVDFNTAIKLLNKI